MRPKDIGTKVCEQCGREYARTQSDRGKRWEQRKFCSHGCSVDARTEPLEKRLWRRVQRTESGCWEWTGYRGPKGYGQIGLGGKAEGIGIVHRVAWELTNGPIPDGLFVCHHCDNPPCCNPDHLFLGTNSDNVADRVRKGRDAKGARLPHTKLTDDQVREIREKYDRAYGPPKRGGRKSNADELAAEYDISRVYVLQLVHGWFRKDA